MKLDLAAPAPSPLPFEVIHGGPLREFEDDMFTTAMARANKTKLFLALHQAGVYISTKYHNYSVINL